MALPNEIALSILKSYKSDIMQNQFAQSSASFILHEVNEDPNNFPKFDPLLIDKVTISAYAILAAGISLHETNPSMQSVSAIEEAATLLTNIHFSRANVDVISANHILVASMAFYASGQYSRAFVTIRSVKFSSRIAEIIRLYLCRRRQELIRLLNEVLLGDRDPITCFSIACETAVELAIAQSLSYALEFQATGIQDHIISALNAIDAGIEISTELMSPSLWWISRLLKLIIRVYSGSSLWTCLTPFFPDAQALLRKYIQLSAFSLNPVLELWRSQIDAIPIALDSTRRGAVVNMRTSSGKTRIAELCILQTIASNPNAKILYIAPYRSLALEIEQSLCQIFDWLGYHASHLYGGFRFSAADRRLTNESTITIATPEKTRAIVRSSPELMAEFKLIVVDEGHMIGADERLIRNELFIDHLRVVTQSSGGKMLLLSAVLPNPADLAQWVSGSADNVAKSEWKPSAERFGLLRWNGNRVRIEWKGEFESFNPNFVVSSQHSRQIDHKSCVWKNRRVMFPNNKKEAIAATAVRLTSIGPVMIFCGLTTSIPGMAASVVTAMGETTAIHPWPKQLWNTFEASCREEFGSHTIEYTAARVGVICHSNSLPPQVRMATERLMRSMPPKVIVATSTLAQGVNIGISSVIIASPYIGDNIPIKHRDFWNICGRAGRAFVDGEGKILYAIDEALRIIDNSMDKNKQKKIRKENEKKIFMIEKNFQMAQDYFNVHNYDKVESGLLYCLSNMKEMASSIGINFECLMDLVAENDFSSLGENRTTFDNYYSMIDDALLAIIEDNNIRSEIDNTATIIDRVFRTSLAAIQARLSSNEMNADDVVNILQHRVAYLMSDCSDANERRACVSSGLPYRCAKNLYHDRAKLKDSVDEIVIYGINTQRIIKLLEWIEGWSRLHGDGVIENWPEKSEFDLIRDGWINGTSTFELNKLTKHAREICKNIYGYQMPWIIHAGAQILAKEGNEEHSEILGNLAAFVEFGLPCLNAVNIFLAGIRSRVAACELATKEDEWASTHSEIRIQLCSTEFLDRIAQISDDTKCWLQLLESDATSSEFVVPNFPRFTVKELLGTNPEKILVRSFDESIYLCTMDGRRHEAVQTDKKWPFNIIADDLRFAFVLNNEKYQLEIRDPRIVRNSQFE